MSKWPPDPFVVPAEPIVTSVGRHFRELHYSVIKGYRPLTMDVWTPTTTSPMGVVLWVHGGAFFYGDRITLPGTLAPHEARDTVLAAGLAFATIDYRLSGECAFPGQLHDVKAAIRYLRHCAPQLGIDGDRIGLWGESAGGHLVSFAALTGDDPAHEGTTGALGVSSAVTCCVDWYGPVDFETLLQGPPNPNADEQGRTPEELLIGEIATDRPDLLAAASPINFVTANAVPMLLMHGEDDSLVPVKQSVDFAAALTTAGVEVEFVTVPGANHIFMGYPDVTSLVKQSVAYLQSRLSN